MADEPKPSMLDVVSAAVASVDNPTKTTGDDDADANQEPVGGDAVEGDSDPAAAAAEDGAAGDGAAEGGDDADGGADEGASDGDAAGDDSKTKPDAAGAKPAEPVKPQDNLGKRPRNPVIDPVNDPIPDYLQPGTRKRMQTLIDLTKSKDQAIQQVTAERDDMLRYVTETGATPEQYAQTLNILRAVNSNDPAQQEVAFQALAAEAQRLGALLGKTLPGASPLAGHPDLEASVQAGDITPQHAQEIALARNKDAIAKRDAEMQRTLQANTVAKQQSDAALDAFQAECLANDPHWPQKRAILVASLKDVMARTPYPERAAVFKSAYQRLSAGFVPTGVARTPGANAGAGGARPAGQPAAQPLRGKSPAGGVAKAPSSMLEAVTAGLQAGSGR